jgi:transcriptional regulator with XRE-family HTH domain
VSKLERGIAYVGLGVIRKFSNVLGVPPDAFLKPLARKSPKKRA